jgi:hypothetical protein
MTSHRLSLTLILIAVAAAGVIVGYALDGITNDSAPLLEAIATSVAPPAPTAVPTPRLIETLPLCDDPDVQPRTLCAPVRSEEYQTCNERQYVPIVEYAVPCYKP